jgi:putative selenate reductase
MAASAPVVVLGGGVAGLAAGYYLARTGYPVTVVERGPVTG